MTPHAVTETDLSLPDGRVLHVYDTGATGASEEIVAVWHHGTPNIGLPPAPLFAASERLGIRWISHDRPGYGGSTPRPGRDVASVAGGVAAVADALGIDRFAVMGHSGGGAHALACGALLPDRVLAVVSVSGLAPRGAEGLDWFGGMYPGGEAELRAAIEGRDALAATLEASEFDPEMFTPEDHAALAGAWSWFGSVVGPALAGGPGGMIDDDLATVASWGFDPAAIAVPVLLVHGDADRMVPAAHATWLAERIAGAELWQLPGAGHISALHAGEEALAWVRGHAGH